MAISENEDVTPAVDEVITPVQTEDSDNSEETDEPEENTDADENEEADETAPETIAEEESKPKKKRFGRRPHKPTKKQAIIGGSVFGVVLLLCLIPFTRNIVLGSIFKTSANIEVYDEIKTDEGQTARVQLTDLTVKVDGKEKVTKASSPIHLSELRPGKHTVEISKANYKTTPISTTFNLKFGKQNNSLSTKLEATGLPTAITVTNGISGDTVADIDVSYKGSKAITDEKGKALLILPIQTDKKYAVTLTGKDFLDGTAEVTVDGTQKPHVLTITPAGKVYFLSKQSGKIDVVKTNLDGSNRQVVLAGTGNEVDGDTTMISTTDWKYLALSTHRADKKSQLILIDTSDDSQTTMDEGNATFTLLGWDGNRLAYKIENQDIGYYTSGRFKIKGYDATAKKLSTYVQNTAQGTGYSDGFYEYFDQLQIVNHQILYTTSHVGNNFGSDESTVNSANIATATKKKLFGSGDGYVTLSYASVDEAYYSNSHFVNGTQQTDYFEVDANGNWKTSTKPETTDQFTYFISPDSTHTLWSEPRDGKQTVLLGDSEAKNSKKLYTLSELKPYAWLTNDYALYSKNDSELYIASLKENSTPKKIADYHRPANITFKGYGGGGGGPY